MKNKGPSANFYQKKEEFGYLNDFNDYLCAVGGDANSSRDFLEDFPSVKKEHAIQVLEHFENLLKFSLLNMYKVLLDENLPVKFKYRLLNVCEIYTVTKLSTESFLLITTFLNSS